MSHFTFHLKSILFSTSAYCVALIIALARTDLVQANSSIILPFYSGYVIPNHSIPSPPHPISGFSASCSSIPILSHLTPVKKMLPKRTFRESLRQKRGWLYLSQYIWKWWWGPELECRTIHEWEKSIFFEWLVSLKCDNKTKNPTFNAWKSIKRLHVCNIVLPIWLICKDSKMCMDKMRMWWTYLDG